MDHYSRAEACLTAADAYRLRLDDLYAAGNASHRVEIADCHERIRVALKAAGVHATLAQADAIQPRIPNP